MESLGSATKFSEELLFSAVTNSHDMVQEQNSNSEDLLAADSPAPKTALSFILLTLFIDVLGIGIIIPVLPELVKSFLESDAQLVAGKSAEELKAIVDSSAGWYIDWIGASYALMQLLFAPI